MGKENVKELKKEIKEIKKEYKDKKLIINKKAKEDLEENKYDYKLKKMNLKKPLKSEKNKIKIEKRKTNKIKNEPPKRSLLEELGSAITHGIGALIGVLFLFLMLKKSNDSWRVIVSIVYGLCFFLQMLFSCLYHSFKRESTVKRIFRRFDYLSIYLQIGGTFAPIYLVYMQEKMWGYPTGLIFFIIQWAFIILGITLVSVFGPGRNRWIHFTLYFCIGWSGLIFLPFMIENDLNLFLWILGGGLAYTIGMIPFAAFKKTAGAHFIWHFFVLLGAILQFIGIYFYIL